MRSTILEIVHQEGEQLIDAQRRRARAILDNASEVQLALLGPPAAEAMREELNDVPPCDDPEEAPANRVPVWVRRSTPKIPRRSRIRRA